MKMFLKSALAVVAMAGAASMVPGLANAGVSIGISLPGVVYAPGYSAYQGQYYYEPVYFGGAWYHGPYRWRMRHGERVFWVNGAWRRNEWQGNSYPDSITFRNGGDYRDGRYEGWGGADRFNARFQSDNHRNYWHDHGNQTQDRNWGNHNGNDMQNNGNASGDRHDDHGDNQQGDAPHYGSDQPHH